MSARSEGTEPEALDRLRLDHQLCFALYAASHAVIGNYREVLDGIGLTFPQYLVLLALWERDGQTITSIGRRLRLDSGTMTPLLKRLEQSGLLERRRSRQDERAIEVYLTERGRGLRPAAAEARGRVVCRLGMSDDEIETLRGDLMRLIERLDTAEEGPARAA